MKILRCLVLLSLVIAPLYAQASSGFAVDFLDNLYRLNLVNASTSLIGNTGAFLEGLALSPDGRLYGTDVGGNLYRISKTTGAATLIGNTGAGDIEGLHFNGNQLLGVALNGDPDVIFSINLQTAAITTVVTAQRATGGVRAMTVLDSNHVLVSAPSPIVNDHGLYSIDLTTGVVKLLAQLDLGNATFLAGLDFDQHGNLFGLDGNGNVWLIDLAHSHVTLVGTFPTYWLDLAASS